MISAERRRDGFRVGTPLVNTRAEDLEKTLQELILKGALTGKVHAELETEAKRVAAEKGNTLLFIKSLGNLLYDRFQVAGL